MLLAQSCTKSAPEPLFHAYSQAMQQPLAVAIISGLLVQLPLVLLVMPSLYALLGGTRTKPRQRAKLA